MLKKNHKETLIQNFITGYFLFRKSTFLEGLQILI